MKNRERRHKKTHREKLKRREYLSPAGGCILEGNCSGPAAEVFIPFWKLGHAGSHFQEDPYPTVGAHSHVGYAVYVLGRGVPDIK